MPGPPPRVAELIVLLLRYLDVCLVLATAPVVLIGGMPVLGYALGAGAWMLTRAGAALVQQRALSVRDARARAALQMAAMLGRVWLVVLAVVLARYAGDRSDGIMAAALVLAAFTVYFLMSLLTRPFQLRGSSGRAQGRPTQGRPSVS